MKNWDPNLREVFRGASVAFAARLGGAAARLGQNVAVAWLLGPSQTGLFLLASTSATVAAMAGRLGLDNTLVRFSAACAAQNDWRGVRGVASRSMAMVLVGSTAAAVVLLVGAKTLAIRAFDAPMLAPALVAVAVAIVPMSIYTVYGQLLKGIKRTGQGVFVLAAAAPAVSVVLILAMAPRWGLMGAVTAYVLAAVVAAVLGGLWWRRAVPPGSRPFPAQELLRSSLPLFVHSMLQMVVRHASLVMLGIFSTSSDVGVYGIAFRTAFLVSYVLIAVNSIAAPKFSALHAEGKRDALRRTAQGSTFLMCLVAAPVLAVFVVFPDQVMRVYSSDFASGGTLMAILAVGQFVNVATGSVQMLLIMCGHERWIVRTTTVAAALALILNSAFIPRWGAVGAAVATSTVWVVQNLLVLVAVRFKLGFWVTPSLKAWRGKG